MHSTVNEEESERGSTSTADGNCEDTATEDSSRWNSMSSSLDPAGIQGG